MSEIRIGLDGQLWTWEGSEFGQMILANSNEEPEVLQKLAEESTQYYWALEVARIKSRRAIPLYRRRQGLCQ